MSPRSLSRKANVGLDLQGTSAGLVGAYTAAVKLSLNRIQRLDSTIAAFNTMCPDVLSLAQRLDDEAGTPHFQPRPLHGVTLAVKDLGDHVAGVPHTYGVSSGPHLASIEDSRLVARAKRWGAIVVGKTSTPAFGHRTTTINIDGRPTRSPVTGGNAGGSSGGSAAAVAAGMTRIAFGSDAAGSIRVPASLCGVLGLKPTAGRVAGRASARTGVLLAQGGPIARNVADLALALDVMAGPTDDDPSSLPAPCKSFVAATTRPIVGTSVSVCTEFGGFRLEPEVAEAIELTVAMLSAMGCRVTRRRLNFDMSHQAMQAAALRGIGHSVTDAIANVYGPAPTMTTQPSWFQHEPVLAELVRRTLREGAACWRDDESIRASVAATLSAELRRCDVIVSATTATAYVAHDSKMPGPVCIDGQTVDPIVGWCLTYPCNFSGHPAITIPLVTTRSGHPVGVQVIGPRFGEPLLLSIAAACERTFQWRNLPPI